MSKDPVITVGEVVFLLDSKHFGFTSQPIPENTVHVIPSDRSTIVKSDDGTGKTTPHVSWCHCQTCDYWTGYRSTTLRGLILGRCHKCHEQLPVTTTEWETTDELAQNAQK